MSRMSDGCRGCGFLWEKDGNVMCQYSLISGLCRGCPAGKTCTKFMPKEDVEKKYGKRRGIVIPPASKGPYMTTAHERQRKRAYKIQKRS